ncbi:MAG: HEAT repeat domain-containing protein [Vicinamibacterales bacterium]
MTRSTIAVVLALAASACASVPVPAPPSPTPPTYQQKLSWILQLEDQRALRDPAPPIVPAPLPVVPLRGKAAPSAVPPPPPPDLIRLLNDDEGRVRRRAALAIGRVGRAEGVAPLTALLKDPEPEVRQMAAFAIGLIGDKRGIEPLVSALGDVSPLVQGSAAEGLGLIGDASAALPIARRALEIVTGGALDTVPDDSEDVRRDTPAAAYRLALYALARLKSYDALASATLAPTGRPRVAWWPVAYALQRLEDPRALPALLSLVSDQHPYTRAFAVKGLGATKDKAAVAALIPLVSAPEMTVAVEAVRSLARLGDASAAPALLRLLQARGTDPHVRVEAVAAIGAVGGVGVTDVLIDLLGDPTPAIRGAAIRSFAQCDPEGFMAVLSGLDTDNDWTVRSALASALGAMPADAGLPRLRTMLDDMDVRVVPSVLAAIAKLKPGDAGSIALTRLKAEDAVVRSAAAQAVAELRPANGAEALVQAYARGMDDQTYVGRASALKALAAYGAVAAMPSLTKALDDKDWPVRVLAATLSKALDPTSDAEARVGLAPTRDSAAFMRPSVIDPPFSTEAFIETARGEIRIELAVLDAPLTVANFVALARQGYFDNTQIHRVVPDFVVQAGDLRGDGEGTPGYTIRDELNERSYVRGTVGMALDFEETGGSQFFITHTPQPHLDARYTVFGRVLSGMDVVDQIQQGDVISRVRIWDGRTN